MHEKPVSVRLAKRLGKNLRAVRQEHAMSQERVAELADLSVFYVIRIENQRANPSLKVVERLAAVFGLDPLLMLAEARTFDERRRSQPGPRVAS